VPLVVPPSVNPEASWELPTAPLAILALVIALLAIVVTPVFDTVTSPVTATDVATFELLPTRTFPLVKVASLLNAIAALAAREVFVTEPVEGVLVPESEMVKVYVSDGIVLGSWFYGRSLGCVVTHSHGAFDESIRHTAATHKDVVNVFAKRLER